jgi:chromosome segregation ATPase
MKQDARTRISVLVFIGCLATAVLAARDAVATGQAQTAGDCDSYRSTLSNLNNEFNEINSKLQAANTSIGLIRADLTRVDANRCASNFAYTDSLRMARKWLLALEAFKEWIATSSATLEIDSLASVYATFGGIIADDQFQNENIVDVNQFIEDVTDGFLGTPERIELGSEFASEEAIAELIERRLEQLSNKITSLTEEEIKAGEEHADYLDAVEVEEQKQLNAIDSLSAQLVSLNGELKTVQSKLEQQCGGY